MRHQQIEDWCKNSHNHEEHSRVYPSNHICDYEVKDGYSYFRLLCILEQQDIHYVSCDDKDWQGMKGSEQVNLSLLAKSQIMEVKVYLY